MVSTLGRGPSVEHLKAVAEFKNCSREQLEEVARLAERVQVAPGEMLTKEGRIGREFFLILSGTVAVTQKGRRVNTLGPGQFFGELAAVNPGPRTATVMAMTELDVLIIGPREFATMSEIPGFRDSLLKTMAQRLRSADATLSELADRQEGAPPQQEPEQTLPGSGSPDGDWHGDI